MKKKTWFMVLLTLGLLVITPQLNELVNQTREVPGYGGECLIWALPPLIYGLYCTLKETTNVWKG